MPDSISIWVWVGLIALFAIIESFTFQLVSIWFALGAFAALIANAFSLSPIWQVTAFCIVSLIAVIATRPIVKRLMSSKNMHRTNADRNIGRQAIVTEEINNLESRGLVSVDGNVWTARSVDSSIISKGETVIVDGIDGVKLIVEKIK